MVVRADAKETFLSLNSNSLAAFGFIEDSITFINRMWQKVELFRSRRFTRNVELGFFELFSQKYQIYFQYNQVSMETNNTFTFTTMGAR